MAQPGLNGLTDALTTHRSKSEDAVCSGKGLFRNSFSASIANNSHRPAFTIKRFNLAGLSMIQIFYRHCIFLQDP